MLLRENSDRVNQANARPRVIEDLMWHICCAVSLRVDLTVAHTKPCALRDLTIERM